MKKQLSLIAKGALAAILLCGAIDGAAQNATVKIKVGGIKSSEGNVLVAIGDMSSPQSGAMAMAAAKEGSVEVTIANVPAGKTSLNVFHDENSNYKMEMGRSGIPQEGCYRGKIKVKETDNEISIKLVYYGKR